MTSLSGTGRIRLRRFAATLAATSALFASSAQAEPAKPSDAFVVLHKEGVPQAPGFARTRGSRRCHTAPHHASGQSLGEPSLTIDGEAVELSLTTPAQSPADASNYCLE
jgi:hypothetical protein